jgi:hypothetical protein
MQFEALTTELHPQRRAIAASTRGSPGIEALRRDMARPAPVEFEISGGKFIGALHRRRRLC